MNPKSRLNESLWVSPASEIEVSSFLSIHVSLSGRPSRFLSHMASPAIMSRSFLHSCCLQGEPHTTITCQPSTLHWVCRCGTWVCVWQSQDVIIEMIHESCVFMPHPTPATVIWCFISEGLESCRRRVLRRARLFSWAESCSGRDSTTLSRGTEGCAKTLFTKINKNWEIWFCKWTLCVLYLYWPSVIMHHNTT